ncbi:MAG: GAF domain-containing protein, partial [Chloroflexota bacterium]
MPDLTRKTGFLSKSFLQRRLLPALVLIYQLAALAIFIIAPMQAFGWMERPFIGAFIEQTMMINTLAPSQPGSWEVHELEFDNGHQIANIDSVETPDSRTLYDELAKHQYGDVVTLGIKSPAGSVENFSITLAEFPPFDRIAYFFIPYLIGLIYLISSLWVFIMRYKDSAGRVFSVFTTSVAIALATLMDVFTTHQFTYLWTLCLALCGSSLFSLALIFPEEVRLAERFSFIRYVAYLPVALLVLFGFPAIYNYANPTAYVYTWRVAYILAGIAILFFLGITIVRRVTSVSPIAREQARLTLMGAAIAFGPIAAWFLITVIFPKFVFTPFLLLLVGAFPIFTGYSVLRYRLLSTDYLVSRGFLYLLLAGILSLAFALLVTGSSLILGDYFYFDNPLAAGIAVFLIALLLNPLRNYLQRHVDNIFSKGQAAYREQLQAFSRELTQAMELPKIIQVLRRYIATSLRPAQLHIFVFDALSDHFIAYPDESGQPTTDLRFASNSSLVQALSSRRNSIFLGEAQTVPAYLQAERARLVLLGAQIYIPLPGRKQLAGWVAMGARTSGEPFADRDLSFLESLSDQAALAVERAQVVANLERRMHEMNVLTRVSQGINVTLAFDDILELLYAQTTQVIPTVDFRITLNDSYSNYLFHVFYLENDERLNERENLPLPLGQGLEQEIAQSRRPIVTDDYERECRNRGVLPSTSGLMAWMGVPLNAGAETIGMMTLGSRDPSVTYTEEQMNLFQAIADQAAGAIVKGRLLQESERRTRQLTSLNEVARSLTSTLELDSLLNQILQSAVEILN